MPMLEPSLAGLTNSGRPRRATTACQSLSAVNTTHSGTGMPAACQNSLLRHLSIASAEASTPLPV